MGVSGTLIMYIFDKNVFISLGQYYPSRFPTIWDKIEKLTDTGALRSVKEVRREIEFNCPIAQISEWVSSGEAWAGTISFPEHGRIAEVSLPKYNNRPADLHFKVKH